MRRCVYLAGAIAGRTWEEASRDRDLAKRLLTAAGWDVLDPLRGKEILTTMDTIDERRAAELLGVTPEAIVSRDRDDIRRADVVLILSGDTPSYGTLFEWEFAHSLGKPVVVVASSPEVRSHPWCRTMASYFASTVEDGVRFIIEWLERGYALDDEDSRALRAWMAGYVEGSSVWRNGDLLVTGVDPAVFPPFLEAGAERKSPTSVRFSGDVMHALLRSLRPFFRTRKFVSEV